MISRRFLTILVYGLPILVVAFGVLMGAKSLAQATNDTVAANVLWWIAVACLVTLLVNLVLLVGVLGVEALSRQDNRRGGDDSLT